MTTPNDRLNTLIVIGILSIAMLSLYSFAFGRNQGETSTQLLLIVSNVMSGLIGFLSRGNSKASSILGDETTDTQKANNT